jgi:hypothetical protein
MGVPSRATALPASDRGQQRTSSQHGFTFLPLVRRDLTDDALEKPRLVDGGATDLDGRDIEITRACRGAFLADVGP